MTREVIRTFVHFKSYFRDFYNELDQESKEKVNQVLLLIKHQEHVPVSFLKYIKGSNGIYEIRIRAKRLSIRIMCFFEPEDNIVLLNSFKKTKQKTPVREIRLAQKLKKQYDEEKHG